MSKSTRSAKRTHSINGKRLRYALSEWQFNVVVDASVEDGRPWEEIADEFAMDFFDADLRADLVLDALKRHRIDYAMALLQSMLDDGAIDAFALAALVTEAGLAQSSQRQRENVAKRHALHQKTRDWIVEHWERRKAGEFATRDAFVDWCRANCPGGVDVDHDRIRDKWLPRGRANEAGPRARAK